MQGVHELGHVLAAFVSGGNVEAIVWHFSTISRTDVRHNPAPMFVCWSGPVLGAGLPLLIHVVMQLRNVRSSGWTFYCGFCLLANGAYLAAGSFDRIGDAGTLISLGCPIGVLWIAGCVMAGAGIQMWHRMGSVSDIGRAKVSLRNLCIQVFLLLGTVIVQQFVFRAA